MRLLLIPAAAVLAAAAVGCSSELKTMPMATSPEQARPALELTLTAWKDGRTQSDLKAQSPPVYFNDDDFVRGRKLVAFTIDGDGRPVGTGLRYDVTLTLQDGTKPPATRKLAYRVVTEPNISVSREDK
jgi:hypothetical protein